MIAVVSHDAGGAEVVSSHIRSQAENGIFVLDGPAVNIFARKLGKLETGRLEDAIGRCDWLLCGTSWQSDLEWRAIAVARRLGKRSVAFLDHWVNYRTRFVRDGVEHFPDEIWVGDKWALDIARETFTSIDVRLFDNPYFEDIERQLKQLAGQPAVRPMSPSVLYVTEPIAEHALRDHGDERFWGYTEYDALRYFLENHTCLGPLGKIVVRPHPSEAADKYDWALEEFELPLERGGRETLLQEVAAADIVVGCESMALVVALLAQRRVISTIPPGGRPCVLPQAEIETMQNLVALAAAGAPKGSDAKNV